jgi:radical SAM superfamily enzyme YgiQ (UPF0313 family)
MGGDWPPIRTSPGRCPNARDVAWRERMKVLLISTYELGHQPLHVSSPAAALLRAGHDVRALDLSVEAWDSDAVASADAIAFSVPMHTAMRLALQAATAIRTERPSVPLCLYGLYAAVARDHTVGSVVDRVIAGEYEPELLRWVESLPAGAAQPAAREVFLEASPFAVPARQLLPGLEQYARLLIGDDQRLAGYVEASHGCVHRCRHCPLPVVYDGRIRVVDVDTILADVSQLVAIGARHITFGDPDFLNGPHHSRRIVRAVHDRFPQLTFDCTAKVEHILRHDDVWDEWAAAGCIFVVSAFESVNDDVLARLDKGHGAEDAAHAVRLLRQHRIEVRPSWLPFTPWTTLDDMVALFDFVAANDLIQNVDPVQYTIRLLLPEGSLLLEHPDMAPFLGDYDPEALSYRWTSAEPAVAALHSRLAAVVEAGTADGHDAPTLFTHLRAVVHEAAGLPVPSVIDPSIPGPRLSEAWFCCAEPTARQMAPLPLSVLAQGGAND